MALTSQELFDEFAEDFIEESSSRNVIIIGASKIDDTLLKIVTNCLREKKSTTKQLDELLEGDRPLATFSARIKMAYRLGLIEETMLATLESLRKLRNKAAHTISFNIKVSPMKEHASSVLKLVQGRASFKLTDQRYFGGGAGQDSLNKFKCSMLTICVVLEAIASKTRRMSQRTSLIKISSN